MSEVTIKNTNNTGTGLSGLSNIGNSCYINSCMQIFSNTKEFNKILDNINSKINKNIDSVLINEWNDLRKMMWSKNCSIAPVRFVKIIQKICNEKNLIDFINDEQNDVMEFLLFIIDTFHNALKREVSMEISGVVENSKDVLASECYKVIQENFQKEYSEILNLFFGVSINEIVSLNTNEVLSRKCEIYSVLTLSIPEGQNGINLKNCTLDDCLQKYMEYEILKDDNAWFNEKTQKKENIKKNLTFWNFPNILIITLKRFDNYNNKISTLVTTKIENMDFSNYLKCYKKEDYIYDLYGTINHIGNTYGGHYTANIKNMNDKWYNYNDMFINEININKIITNETYCMFYRKKNKF